VGTKVIIAFGSHNFEDIITYVQSLMAGTLGTASDTTAGSTKISEDLSSKPRAVATLVSEAATPDMTLIVNPFDFAGFDQNIRYAGDTTATFTAPTVNPRIDLLVYSTVTSALAYRTGAEGSSPTPVTPTTGDIVLCSVYHKVGETSIKERSDGTNGYIERWYTPSIFNGSWMPGDIKASSSYLVPSGWLRADGAAVSRSTYSTLFAAISPTIGTCTITQATPGVVTCNSHGLQINDAVYLTTTGTLLTGLAENTIYYIITAGFTANAFQLSATRGGAAINTTSTQSGVHTLHYCPYGLGNGSTTFNLPNLKGKVIAGYNTTDTEFSNLGYAYGEKTHVLLEAELAAHTHTTNIANSQTGGGIPGWYVTGASFGQGGDTLSVQSIVSTSVGSDTAHNNVQPSLSLVYLIKT
jgi:microcystin-dependent protein